MPGKKDAWDKAKKLRDKEFDQRDTEIKKWKDLYKRWRQLVENGDIDGAKAKNAELSKQGQVVADCMSVIDGKLEAMTALQAATKKDEAKRAIRKLVKDEADEFYEIATAIFPDFMGGAFSPAKIKNHRDAIAKLNALSLQIKGKEEIAAIVEKDW
jgi:hypothetical protein